MGKMKEQLMSMGTGTIHAMPRGKGKINVRGRLEKHYDEWFNTLGDDSLFRIYNVDDEIFISPAGAEGSIAMNRFTLAKTIAAAQADDEDSVKSWIAIMDSDTLDFSNPVFIGSEDA